MEIYKYEYKYPPCFLCLQPVLRIHGQDIHLPWQALKPEDENTELSRTLNFGDAHLSCLIASEWGSLVAQRLYEFEVKNWFDVGSNAKVKIVKSTPLNYLSIIRNDGWYLNFRYDLPYQKVDDGVLVQVSTDYSIDNKWVSPLPTLHNALKATFDDRKPYSYIEFIKAFNVEDKLLDSIPLAHGTVTPKSEWIPHIDGGVVRRELAEGTLEVEAKYHAFIPNSIWRIIPDEYKKSSAQ